MASFQKRDPEPHDEKFRELLDAHGGSPLMVFDSLMDYCSYDTDLFGADPKARLQEFSYVFNKYSDRWNSRVQTAAATASKLVVYDENIQQRVRRQALYQKFVESSNVELRASEESFDDTGSEDGDQLRRFARYHKFFQHGHIEESYGDDNDDRDQFESNFQESVPNTLMIVPYNINNMEPAPAQGIMFHPPGGPPMYQAIRIPMLLMAPPMPPNGLPNHGGPLPLRFYSPIKFAPVAPAHGNNENAFNPPNLPAEHQQQYHGGPNMQYQE